MSTKRQTLGLAGERQAERFLRHKGLRTVARRYSTPVGEIDLIMRDGDTLVFVEVKTRRDRRLADPQDAVDGTKRQHLTRAARWFLRHQGSSLPPCRFDVVGVVMVTKPQSGWLRLFRRQTRTVVEFEHIESAFEPE